MTEAMKQCVQNLALAILIKAIEDTKKAILFENERELKRLKQFFYSRWCDELLIEHPFTGREIYNYLIRDRGVTTEKE